MPDKLKIYKLGRSSIHIFRDIQYYYYTGKTKYKCYAFRCITVSRIKPHDATSSKYPTGASFDGSKMKSQFFIVATSQKKHRPKVCP